MNAIEVDGISKILGSRNILEDVSFQVKKSHIHGLLGPNGAGKTTTMRILSGLMNASSGRVAVDGVDIKNYGKKLYQKIGFLIEEPPLYKDMIVEDYLKFVAGLRSVKASDINSRLDYCINELDLTTVRNRSIENLSRGFRQRVGIAQAIMHDPDIVILDEPNLGLDPRSIVEIRDLIQKLKENHTVILSSHLLHEMSLVCDDITIISHGKILQTGQLNKLKESLKSSQSFTLTTIDGHKDFESFLTEDPRISDFSSLKKENEVEYHITAISNDEIRPSIVKKAVDLDLEIIALQKDFFSLEDYFLKITESHD